MSSGTTYSRTHRLLEITAIAAYVAILLVCTHGTLTAGWTTEYLAWVLAASAVIAGFICADFVSGFVHWLADSFGSVNMPVVGEAYIKPFREHHDDPQEITRHDFIEVNGNNCVVILLFLPFVAATQALLPAWAVWIEGWAIAFTLAIFLTNQIHSWAHADSVPRIVRWLQRKRLILSVDDHDIHHTVPHDTYFCITFGWCNPVLHRINFFGRLYRLVIHVLPFAANTDAELASPVGSPSET